MPQKIQYETLASTLDEAMSRLQCSQNKLASILGINSGNMAALRAGRKGLSWKKTCQLALIVNADAYDLADLIEKQRAMHRSIQRRQTLSCS